MAGWTGGIGIKARLRPAKAGAGAKPELGNKLGGRQKKLGGGCWFVQKMQKYKKCKK